MTEETKQLADACTNYDIFTIQMQGLTRKTFTFTIDGLIGYDNGRFSLPTSDICKALYDSNDDMYVTIITYVKRTDSEEEFDIHIYDFINNIYGDGTEYFSESEKELYTIELQKAIQSLIEK